MELEYNHNTTAFKLSWCVRRFVASAYSYWFWQSASSSAIQRVHRRLEASLGHHDAIQSTLMWYCGRYGASGPEPMAVSMTVSARVGRGKKQTVLDIAMDAEDK